MRSIGSAEIVSVRKGACDVRADFFWNDVFNLVCVNRLTVRLRAAKSRVVFALHEIHVSGLVAHGGFVLIITVLLFLGSDRTKQPRASVAVVALCVV